MQSLLPRTSSNPATFVPYKSHNTGTTCHSSPIYHPCSPTLKKRIIRPKYRPLSSRLVKVCVSLSRKPGTPAKTVNFGGDAGIPASALFCIHSPVRRRRGMGFARLCPFVMGLFLGRSTTCLLYSSYACVCGQKGGPRTKTRVRRVRRCGIFIGAMREWSGVFRAMI